MPDVTGTIAALGVSFAAGSTEDGVSGNNSLIINSLGLNGNVEEGTYLTKPEDYIITNKPSWGSVLNGLSTSVGMVIDAFAGLFKTVPTVDPFQALSAYLQGINATRRMHFPKPVLIAPGMIPELNTVPRIVPLQILSNWCLRTCRRARRNHHGCRHAAARNDPRAIAGKPRLRRDRHICQRVCPVLHDSGGV